MTDEIPQRDPDEHAETSHYARCKWCGTLDPTAWAVVVGPDGEIKEIECNISDRDGSVGVVVISSCETNRHDTHSVMKDTANSEKSADEVGRVVIAQCTDSKRDGTHTARNLYDESAYFQRQREYAEAVADKWFIQSALYGLLHPDDVVDSYNQHAKDVDDAEAWGAEIADDLAAAIPETAVVELLGGKAYADPLTPELEARGFEVHEPLRGQRIGTRRKSLKEMANMKLEGFA